MALDKLVDSTQLDADLTSVADAIRAKTGKESTVIFPNGFISEVNHIRTKSKNLLPDGYTQIDYICFTGLQWIETGYMWNQNSEFIIDFQRKPELMLNYSELLRAASLYLQCGAVNGCYYKIGTMNEKNLLENSIGSNYHHRQIIKSSTTYAEISSVFDNYTRTIEFETTISDTGEVTISQSNRPWTGQVYFFGVKENGTYVVKMIPARRNSDGAIGMYDIIRNQLYEDASGNGLAGGDESNVWDNE